jgi:hypothetical protein
MPPLMASMTANTGPIGVSGKRTPNIGGMVWLRPARLRYRRDCHLEHASAARREQRKRIALLRSSVSGRFAGT